MKIKRIILVLIIAVFLFNSFSCLAVDVTNPTENEEQNQENENGNNNNNNQPAENETVEETEPEETPQPTYTQPATTVSEPKSNNANLASLDLDNEGLSPEFNKDVVEYYLVVGLDIEEIKVNAVAEDSNATVTVSGNKDLIEGENKLQIVVKAEDGTTKVYTIMVIKSNESEEVDAYLESLTITGYNFYPSFKRNIFSYNLTINEKITKLEITAKTEIDDATFVIEGNENLQEGENIIKIIVTARDGETKREYKINTYISTKKAEPFKMNMKQAYVLISILGVAILLTGVFVLKNKNK